MKITSDCCCYLVQPVGSEECWRFIEWGRGDGGGGGGLRVSELFALWETSGCSHTFQIARSSTEFRKDSDAPSRDGILQNPLTGFALD